MNRREIMKKVNIELTKEEITFICDILHLSLKSWEKICDPHTQACYKMAEQIFHILHKQLIELEKKNETLSD